MELTQIERTELLQELHNRYNRVDFIENDPISIPHSFTRKEDIEIAGFLAAAIAWGQRPQIIKSANWLMELMDCAPYDFIMHATESELKRMNKFYYRTFQPVDAQFFMLALRKLYAKGGLEGIFTESFREEGSVKAGLRRINEFFANVPHERRSMKHIANVNKGASAKRLNMYLRWMIRSDKRGVDFGLWKGIPPSALLIPLDVHTGNSARALGLLERKQSDWKAVEELMVQLRIVDKEDPVRFDFALFGAGIEGVLPR